MAAEENRIVLDTDFINMITSYKAGDPKELFRRIFHTLEKQPVVHPYVAENELDTNRVAKELIDAGDIVKISYEEFLPENGIRKPAYEKSFHDLHRSIREAYIPKANKPEMAPLQPNEDIFQRQAGRSFGEIHSILMATELGIPVLLSNDKGAKIAAARYKAKQLIVQNAIEVSELLKKKAEVTAKERKFLRNCYKHRK